MGGIVLDECPHGKGLGVSRLYATVSATFELRSKVTAVLIPGWVGRIRVEGHDLPKDLLTVRLTRQYDVQNPRIVQIRGGKALVMWNLRPKTAQKLDVPDGELLVVVCAPKHMLGTLHVDTRRAQRRQ